MQAYHTRDPRREELGEQLVDNWEKCEWPIVRAVPPVTAFGEVHYNALTPRGGHAAGRKDGIEQVRQHLHSRATRVLEKLRRDPITPRCFVVFEAPHAAAHFIEREFIPQPVGFVPRPRPFSASRSGKGEGVG